MVLGQDLDHKNPQMLVNVELSILILINKTHITVLAGLCNLIRIVFMSLIKKYDLTSLIFNEIQNKEVYVAAMFKE